LEQQQNTTNYISLLLFSTPSISKSLILITFPPRLSTFIFSFSFFFPLSFLSSPFSVSVSSFIVSIYVINLLSNLLKLLPITPNLSPTHFTTFTKSPTWSTNCSNNDSICPFYSSSNICLLAIVFDLFEAHSLSTLLLDSLVDG